MSHPLKDLPYLDEQITADPRFTFIKRVIGYYYYVEIWKYRGIDVVLEEAELGRSK